VTAHDLQTKTEFAYTVSTFNFKKILNGSFLYQYPTYLLLCLKNNFGWVRLTSYIIRDETSRLQIRFPFFELLFKSTHVDSCISIEASVSSSKAQRYF